MNNYKRVWLNTCSFAIGTIGSKLVLFLMLPIYTLKLTKENYGVLELIQNTSSLLFPLLTLMITGALFRFGLDSRECKKEVIANTLFSLSLSSVVFLCLSPLFCGIDVFQEYFWYFVFFFLITMFEAFFKELLKVSDNLKVFSTLGVLDTFLMASLNILFLVKLDFGLQGYFISYILSKFFFVSLSCYVSRCLLISCFGHVNFKKLKEMLLFSVAFLPNTLCWWGMNFSDRYIISVVLGVSFVGVYSVANKIPMLINSIYEVFGQAWHISAIEEKDSGVEVKFYSVMFKVNIIFLSLMTSVMLLCNKSFSDLMISDGFKDAYYYSILPIFGNFFGCLSNFYGAIYLKNKAGRQVLVSSMLALSVNFLINIILVREIGIVAASLSTCIAFFVMWLYRHFDTKKFLKLDVSVFYFLLVFAVLFVQVIICSLQIGNEFMFNAMCFLFLLLVHVFFVKNEIRYIINWIIK